MDPFEPFLPANSNNEVAGTIAHATIESHWSHARQWADMAKGFARAGRAAQVMCGLELKAIHGELFGPRQKGRPKKSQDLGFSWKDLIAEKVGISDSTADNWMKMADSVEKKAIADNQSLAEILKKLPWQWTPEESETISDVTKKLCDGKTQQEILAWQLDFERELDLAKSERGANLLPGSPDRNDKGGPTKQELAAKAPKLTPLEEDIQLRKASEEETLHLIKVIDGWHSDAHASRLTEDTLMAVHASAELILNAVQETRKNRRAHATGEAFTLDQTA